jgi:eukaryotic-like serine/threonine-protein kinase
VAKDIATMSPGQIDDVVSRIGVSISGDHHPVWHSPRMKPPHNLIGRFHSGTPALQPRRQDVLPDDLLREASRRLGVMSLIAGALWFLGTVLGHLAYYEMYSGDPRWLRFEFPDGISLMCVIVSVALFVYLGKTSKSPASILDLGLLYLVFNALCIGLSTHWEPLPEGFRPFPMITWVGAAILMFAAIIPSSPGKMFLAAFMAASMNPISMLLAKARGIDLGPLSNVVIMHYPDFLLVGVGVVISMVVTRLGQQVTRAREMGSYQLGELLGTGGMGEVYRATHRMLARPAAIKLIRPEVLGSPNSESTHLTIQRFKREAEVAANLRSPHTIELYDFGVMEDSTLYYVMELLVGMDLETLVRKNGPLPADRVVFILCQVCESLEEAHQSGLVHRDIKPANIHIGRLGLQQDFVKVLDFGLVKSFEKQSTAYSLATAVGMTPGTPAYMAPELTRGEPVDGRADIYALGCVAYFLLTAQLVFDGANPLDMIMKHYMEEPIRPSRRAKLLVPAALEDVVLSCLAKDPQERPQTAATLARSLNDVPIQRWGQEQAKRWWASETEPVTRAAVTSHPAAANGRQRA